MFYCTDINRFIQYNFTIIVPCCSTSYQQPVLMFGAESVAGVSVVSECRLEQQQQQQLSHVPPVDGVM